MEGGVGWLFLLNVLTRFEVRVCLFWDLVYREVSWELGEAYLVLKAES